MSYLDRIATCRRWDPAAYRPLVIDGRTLGRISHGVARRLAGFPEVFVVSHDSVALAPGLDDFVSRSRAVAEVLGEYRAPTGVATEGASRNDVAGLAGLRARVEGLTETLGRRPKLLIGKPGLDGHSSGAEQIAVRARDAGFEVVYQGIRLTPQALVRTAQEEDVNLVGLSVLSGSHLALVTEVIAGLKGVGLARVPVVVGGMIPPEDAETLRQAGAAAVYTPKDYDLNAILDEIVDIVEHAAAG